MTGIQLSLNQAEDLYRLFVFGPHDLDNGQVENTEELFKTLLLKLDIPRRDIDYLLIRSYLKAFTRKLDNASFKERLQKDILMKLFTRYRGILSVHLFEDLYCYIKAVKHRKLSVEKLSAPVF
jgi:hypothetical protein